VVAVGAGGGALLFLEQRGGDPGFARTRRMITSRQEHAKPPRTHL
jgi:hypothetical protein